MSIPSPLPKDFMNYQLQLAMDTTQQWLHLKLYNADGKLLASNEVKLNDYNWSQWESLLDPCHYVQRSTHNLQEQAKIEEADHLLTDLGLFIGENILGLDIMTVLLESPRDHTVSVNHPPLSHDLLASALNIPWELLESPTVLHELQHKLWPPFDSSSDSPEKPPATVRWVVENSELVSETPTLQEFSTSMQMGPRPPFLANAIQQGLKLKKSPPQPRPLLPGNNLDLEPPAFFVGRSAELYQLATQWIPEGSPAVAWIQGDPGLGKTTLAARAIHWWHAKFDWVVAFQVKPLPLSIDTFLQQIDFKLTLVSSDYRVQSEARPLERVYLAPGSVQESTRLEKMRFNLQKALNAESVLLVIDNFETNLEDTTSPQWTSLLEFLAEFLPNTRSRLLIACRYPWNTASPQAGILKLALQPLTIGESILVLRSHAELRPRLFSDIEGHQQLQRVLNRAGGHPAILNSLAKLIISPTLFDEVAEHLEALEKTYFQLEDSLIKRLPPEARRLLWIISLANEPVRADLIEGVWSGISADEEMRQQFRNMLQNPNELPKAVQQQFDQLPPKIRKMLETAPELAEVPPLEPLTAQLQAMNLIHRQEDFYTVHDLTRERIKAWMAQHPIDLDERTVDEIWEGFGERYFAIFNIFFSSQKPDVQEAAFEMGRRSLMYLIQANAFTKLKSLVDRVISTTKDAPVLRSTIAELEAIIEFLPSGEARWSTRNCIAETLSEAGRSDLALRLFEKAVTEAEAAPAFADVGWISRNWAHALLKYEQWDAARRMYWQSADAWRQSDRPVLHAMISELEALRVDVLEGMAEEALPKVNARLHEVRRWFSRYQQGEIPPEAPNFDLLQRMMVSALDIAESAHREMEEWNACLDLLTEQEHIEQNLGESAYTLALTRFNQYHPLVHLGRLDEAQTLAESCLDIYREAGDHHLVARALKALADLWEERGNTEIVVELIREALRVCNHLPQPEERATAHGNLATALARTKQLEESAQHLLAAIAYSLLANHQGLLDQFIDNLSNLIRYGIQIGESYDIPEVAELQIHPEFEALDDFLEDWEVHVPELQNAIDQWVEHATEETIPSDTNPFADLPPEFQELWMSLFEAIMSGEDISVRIEELRDQLIALQPEASEEIDELLDEMRMQLEKFPLEEDS